MNMHRAGFNNHRGYARQSVDLRRMATADTIKSDTYFSFDGKRMV